MSQKGKIDTEAIKARIDLRELAGQATTLKSKGAGGKELAGPCPRCGGEDRFYVTRDFWACRQCHEKRGDAIEFVTWLDGCTFRTACDKLTGGALPTIGGPVATTPPRPKAQAVNPPGPTWQARAKALMIEAEARLWSDDGAQAMAWLHNRGLDDGHIAARRIGFIAGGSYEHRALWGLAPETNRETGRPKSVWIPSAITLPWETEPDGDLWGLRFRLPAAATGLRYISAPGSQGGAMYMADGLRANTPAMVLEGEIDALTVDQHAGAIVRPVATGSTQGARRDRWLARLALASVVLVAYDNDQSGEKAAHWWLDRLPNARRWRPYWADPNQMAQDGADVRAWVAAGIDAAEKPGQGGKDGQISN